LTHLDGREINISRSKITWPGFKQRIRNEGMPSLTTNKKGALIITFDVQFPDSKFSSQDIENLKNILKSAEGPKLYNGF
jgi:DnaJ-class molecular chaperone